MIVSLVFLAVTTPAVSASPPAGPIAITSCVLQTAHNQMGFGNLFVNGKAMNFFKVGYVNNGHVAADRLVVQVDFSKSRYVIGDTATFAPGVEVTHTYRDHGRDVQASARPANAGEGTACEVLSAHFVDGTTWQAPH